MTKLRLHMPGLPHTITHPDFSHCAFTGKIIRFCPMMLSRDFEVYHYGIETSMVEATRHFDVMSKTEWQLYRILSYKSLHPEKSMEEVEKHLSDPTQFVGDLANTETPLYLEFNKRLKNLLKENYRSKQTDIVCLPFGFGHQNAITDIDILPVETGIGYPDSFCEFRIFESYAKRHLTYGSEHIGHPSNYWFTIPNYYDLSEWSFSDYPEKPRIGYFGRICHYKGLDVFYEIARRFPHIDFVVCGQGDVSTLPSDVSNLSYLPPLCGMERNDFMKTLTAIITPTRYVEPFCGVNVEAQLCGVPVLAPDFGAFAETIEHFRTGLLCHTLADYCFGVQRALDQKFDRFYIRRRAVEKYDMFVIAHQYEYAFRTILDIHNGKNGWYSPDCHFTNDLS